MTRYDKKSRCGFVALKLRLTAGAMFLMREDLGWRDFNLLGGHDKPQDGSSLLRTARRELLEELPLLRRWGHFDLPGALLTGLSDRSANRFISEEEVVDPRHVRISRLAGVLNTAITGGLKRLPLSWDEIVDLPRESNQLEIPFRW